jgi:acyl-CoA synthetase (AMP-forming)/AMP-acid ligase II
VITADLDVLFPDPERAASRRRLAERWRQLGAWTDETLGGLIARAAAEDPDVEIRFLSDTHPGRISLQELHASGHALAGALAASGVRAGDVVAVQVPNRVEAALVYAAVAMAGAVLVPIVHIYGPHETNWILERSGARMFVCPDRWRAIDYLERIERMPAAAKLDLVIISDDSSPRRPTAATRTWTELEAMADPAFRPPTRAADDALLVIYTSGTTADPKGVVHTHQTLLAELAGMPQAPAGVRDRPALQPWPAGHIGGLCAILGPLTSRSPMTILDQWDADRAAAGIDAAGVVALTGTPLHVHQLLDRRDAGTARLDSVRDVVSGGAGVPPAVVERADRAGWRLVRCYGSSEQPTITSGRFEDPLARRAHDDGTPLPHCEVRIVRADGSDAIAGVDGEVWLRGPDQFVGYTDPALNLEAFTPDGWFRSGDVGRLDADGRLAITDRLKDVVIRGGENISSMEVEALLARHPAIAEAAVVGVPDERYGERVGAFLLLRPGADAPSVADLGTHFADLGAARQKTPEHVWVVDDFPRTPAGKVKKHELRGRLPRP